MMSDEEIEKRRQWLEALLGSTHASWYAEACRYEYDANPEVLIWVCRFREMVIKAGFLTEKVEAHGDGLA